MSRHGPVHEHKAHAPTSLRFAVLTVSDSRDLDHDASGDKVHGLVTKAGHEIARRERVKDEAGEIRAAVERYLAAADVDAVVTTGGTGLARRDVTPEAVLPLFERTIPGFGELFRALSHRKVGSAAMLSRAEAGVARGKPVFLLPGSPDACELAMRKLVLPEVGHLVALLRR